MNRDGEISAWTRFFFVPESTATAALMRIVFGALCVIWTLAMIPDLLDFFGQHGVLPATPPFGDPGYWSLLTPFSSDGGVFAVWLMLLIASVAFLVGFETRLAALLVLVGLLSFQRRDPFVFNSGDGLFHTLAFFLLLAPAGAAVSVDRLFRHRRDFWSYPLRAPWALRLIQIQVSVIYLSTVWQKVRGTTWNDGTAVSFSTRLGDLERFHTPHFITDSVLISNLMTYGTLAVEFSLGVLVWNRKLRPWVLLLGVGMHLTIDLTLRVGLFSYAIMCSYLAFLPPERAERVFAWVRGKAAGVRSGRRVAVGRAGSRA